MRETPVTSGRRTTKEATMNRKERYEREAKAKGGSVPPDLRRHSDARNVHAGTEANVSEKAQKDLQKKHMEEKDRREERGTYGY